MVVSTSGGFAALLNDGTVLTWGYTNCHPPPDIATQFLNVKMLFSDHKEFVALLEHGNVFAWSSEYVKIPISLKNVKMVFSNVSAFVALFNDGNVFAWGYEDCGGYIPLDKQDQLRNNVQTIFPQDRGFKAICKDGTVIQWGKQNEDEL
jgi:alpha-tubulin suppressor-like RCC1 family protein